MAFRKSTNPIQPIGIIMIFIDRQYLLTVNKMMLPICARGESRWVSRGLHPMSRDPGPPVPSRWEQALPWLPDEERWPTIRARRPPWMIMLRDCVTGSQDPPVGKSCAPSATRGAATGFPVVVAAEVVLLQASTHPEHRARMA